MTALRLLPLGPHEFDAFLSEGEDATHHRVVVAESLLDEMIPLASEGDELRLVEESMRFLLDRRPADAIPRVVDLQALRYEDPDFFVEVSTRLSA